MREGPGCTGRQAHSACPDTLSSWRRGPFKHIGHIKGTASENWQAQTVSLWLPSEKLAFKILILRMSSDSRGTVGSGLPNSYPLPQPLWGEL